MAQTTRSSSSRSARGRSRSSRSTSKNGTTRTGKSRSTTRNGTSRSTRAGARRTTSNGPVAKTTGKVAAIASKAAPDTETVRKTGQRVSSLASKAKTPLVAGGAALAGLAGGVALKNRTEAKRRPTSRFRSVQLPKSLKNIDLEQIIDAGRRVRSIGEQVGDVADTADKTRKKHK
jgi:hypothetical protein